MELTKYLDTIALSCMGLQKAPTPLELEKAVFTNDLEGVLHYRLAEGRAWYSADDDEILSFYNYSERVEYNTEPYRYKNKRSFFWARSSLEDEMKRTHSGFARDIVDTDVALLGLPRIKVGGKNKPDSDLIDRKYPMLNGKKPQEALDDIMEYNDLTRMIQEEQEPLTLVDGWGAFKITWGEEADVPLIHYYGGERVRIHSRGSSIFGMTFLDWYSDTQGKRYLIAETRLMKDGKGMIRYNCFRELGNGTLAPLSREEAAFFTKAQDLDDLPCLFAVPTSFYADTQNGLPGRSIFNGKYSVFDDIDQAFSQCANAIRRSTPVEKFDLDYCERDKDGIARMPKLFERRYIGIRGMKNAYGEKSGDDPVTVSQPRLDIDMYVRAIELNMKKAINGHLSPTTIGLDTERKDNADAQRESEKITIFTMKHLAGREKRILERLANQLLIAYEYITSENHVITCDDYGVSVEYDEFGNQSFESKITTLATVLANDGISPSMYVSKVYGDSISEADRKSEIKWLESKHTLDTPTVQGDDRRKEGILDGLLDEIGDGE